MESDLTLHEVASSDSPSAVVYLHGVNGSWRETWLNRETGFYWPEGLARAGGWSTYSIQYDAHTNWGGTTMPLQERAASIAELLRDDAQLAGKDIAIVAHSYGGLVAKQLLRHCHDRPRFRDLRERLAATVFVATPHTGAAIATFGHYLRSSLGSTVTLEDLRAHGTLLNELGDWYRNEVSMPAHVLFETRRMRLGWFRRWLMIVDKSSANPGLRGVVPVPVDADHVEISRPAGTQSAQFRSTLTFLEEVFAIPARLAKLPLQAGAVCYRRGAGGVELLLVRTTGGRWTFPKGGIDETRGPALSAAQEALEEAGVTGVIEPQPFTHYLHAKLELKESDGRALRFAVAAYLLEVRNEAAGKPERGRTPTWFAAEQAKRRLAEDRAVLYGEELARVVDLAVSRIAPPRAAAAVVG